MALSQADRIAFSAKVAAAPAQAAGIDMSMAVIQKQVADLSALDTANANIFTTPNTMVNLYQGEISYLDGNVRTTIVEQDIQDSAKKTLGNHFFPNNTSVTVPSLASKNNVWIQTSPYALSYAIGKNYSEAYGVLTNPEPTIITTILAFTTISPVADITAAINLYKTQLSAEAALIPTTDTNPTNQANNQAALNNINGVLIPALNAYLNASHPPPTSQTNPSPPPDDILVPTPDPAVTALQLAVTNRQSFIATRISQINAVLGTITQDINTGNITASSGYYGQRYSALTLRLNLMNGSLSQSSNYSAAMTAQGNLKSSIIQNASTYATYTPTSLFKSDANNLTTIHVTTPTLFTAGDVVYIIADSQDELMRAVKSVNNDVITLNDVVPSKYTVASNVRIYKDAT